MFTFVFWFVYLAFRSRFSLGTPWENEKILVFVCVITFCVSMCECQFFVPCNFHKDFPIYSFESLRDIE